MQITLSSSMARCASAIVEAASVAAALLLSSCATSPKPTVITPEEQIRQDHGVGSHLADTLERRLEIKSDIEVSVYLRRLAETLVVSEPALAGAPLGVFTIRDRDRSWRSFGVPGNRIYLSIGLLRTVDSETELAAALALEFAHIQKRHVLKRLEAAQAEKQGHPSMVEFFGPGGIFTYSDGEDLEAAEAAVDLLYRAGFDPRGLTQLWLRFQSYSESSPYPAETLIKLLERTRQAIALRAPLRNPVVRSRDFLIIRKRMLRL